MPSSYGQRSTDLPCLRPTLMLATVTSVFSQAQNGTNCLKSRRSHTTKKPAESWHNTWRSTQVSYGERFKDIKGHMQNLKVERQLSLFSKCLILINTDWVYQPCRVKKKLSASRRPPVVPATQISSPFILTWAQRPNPYPEHLTSAREQNSLNYPGSATYLYSLCLEYFRFITY